MIAPTTTVKIGEAARRLGVSAGTLKRYEALGQLLPAWKSPRGDRFYNVSDVENFVRRPGGRPSQKTAAAK